jgi:hypothetical protein
MSIDITDSFKILNAMINEWNLERMVKVNPITLPVFPDLTTDVSFWSPYEHILLTTMAVRLRQIYSLPPVQLDVQLAAAALVAFNAINQQQIPPLWQGAPESVGETIFLALRMAGRINDQQSVAAGSKDVYDAMTLLMLMLTQWQRKRWLIWSEKELALISTGASSYTIGSGQDFSSARPDKIHAAFVRIMGSHPTTATSNMADIPLAIIEAREDWSTISIKDLKSIPSAVFYDSAWPVGNLHFWPVPPANDYELHIVVKSTLPVYETLDDCLALPPEYAEAIVTNLACRIIVASGGQISPALAGMARAALETVKMTNAQIPLLSMPSALSGHRGDVSSWAGRGLNHAWTTGGGSVLS